MKGIAEPGDEEGKRILGLWGRGRGRLGRGWLCGAGDTEAGDEHDGGELRQQLDGIRVHRDRSDRTVGITSASASSYPPSAPPHSTTTMTTPADCTCQSNCGYVLDNVSSAVPTCPCSAPAGPLGPDVPAPRESATATPA